MNLVDKPNSSFFIFFKLFSVAFSTAMMVEFSFTYYYNTNVYIATAISLPFAWFYAFKYIGSLEQAGKLKTILISGGVMMAFYLTLASPIKQELDNQALAILQQDIDYMDYKKEFESNKYNPEAYAVADSKYTLFKEKKVEQLNEANWKTKMLRELNSKMYDEKGKKTAFYKDAVSTALLHRDSTSALKKLKNLKPLDSVAKTVYVLWDKEKSSFSATHSSTERATKLADLKSVKNLLSRDYFREKREKARNNYEAMEKEIITKSSFTKTETIVFVLTLGFLVEILLNAAFLWMSLMLNEDKSEIRVNTMLTLLNKELLLPRLDAIGVVHKTGKSKGKVYAVFATLINVIIMYNERDQEKFERTVQITDEHIVAFKYLEVNAKRSIPRVFEILAGRDVRSLSINDIFNLILENKGK